LETNKDSYRVLQISTDLKAVRKSNIQKTKTHDINHTTSTSNIPASATQRLQPSPQYQQPTTSPQYQQPTTTTSAPPTTTTTPLKFTSKQHKTYRSGSTNHNHRKTHSVVGTTTAKTVRKIGDRWLKLQRKHKTTNNETNKKPTKLQQHKTNNKAIAKTQNKMDTMTKQTTKLQRKQNHHTERKRSWSSTKLKQDSGSTTGKRKW
jgi:hypothetical protein